MRPAELDKKTAKPQEMPGKPRVHVVAPQQWVRVASENTGRAPQEKGKSTLSVTVMALSGDTKASVLFPASLTHPASG